MNNGSPEAAKLALRERLGVGARYDAEGAPAKDLGWARLGTAYFARKLNELSDDALDGIGLLPGSTRRRVVSEVGYQARMLALQVEAVRTGEAYAAPSAEEQAEEVELGTTLPARALRNLFAHAEVHLNVEWRDLTDAGWGRSLKIDGIEWPVRATGWRRAKTIWVRAVDLDNGGSFYDFPPDLLDALLAERVRSGMAAMELIPSDRPASIVVGSGDGPRIAGATADLARWLTGRGARHLTCSTEAFPKLPAWM